MIHIDPVVNQWCRHTSPELLSVKTDLKIRVTTTGRIRVRRFYWSLQRRAVSAKTNGTRFYARTLILEPEHTPLWLDFPEDPRLPGASALLNGAADCEVLHYVPLRRLTVIKRGADEDATVFKFKREGRAQEAASRLKRINEAHTSTHTCYSLPIDLGCCSESGALRQTFCPGKSLIHLAQTSASQLISEQLGRVLASFHNVPIANLPIKKSDDLSDLNDTIRQLTAYWPAAADRINRCYDWIVRNKRHEHDITLCHGDLSLENLLVENGQWSLIDLDLAHLGDPVQDLAQLLVQLDAIAAEFSDKSFIPRPGFLTGYLSERPESIPPRSLRWHCCRAELEHLQVAFRKNIGNSLSREASLARAERHCLGIDQ